MEATEKVRKLAEEALAQLSSELEKGHSESLRNYLAVMSRFRQYSWRNVLLIASQRPNATHVAGFHAWHQLGRSVKKGEKGIMIFAPMVMKQQSTPENTSDAPAKEPARLAGFRPAYVFDVEQTDGKPIPQFAQTTGDPKEYTEKLKMLLAKQNITLEYDKSIAPALGVSSGGKIRLQPGLSPAEEFATLAHELAHELMHKSSEAARTLKTVRETQAEAVAFVVCRGIGLETNNSSADYIQLHNGDQKTLAASLAAVQATSAKILDELLPQQRSITGQAPEGASREAANPRSERNPSTPEVQSGTQAPTQSPEPPALDR